MLLARRHHAVPSLLLTVSGRTEFPGPVTTLNYFVRLCASLWHARIPTIHAANKALQETGMKLLEVSSVAE